MLQGWQDLYRNNLESSVNVLKWAIDDANKHYYNILVQRGGEIYLEKEERYKKLMNNVITSFKHNNIIAFCECPNGVNKGELANYIIAQEGYPSIACVWGRSKNGRTCTSSWRSKMVDLNPILRPLGGGGHAKAGGVKFSVDSIDSVVARMSSTKKYSDDFYENCRFYGQIAITIGSFVLSGYLLNNLTKPNC